MNIIFNTVGQLGQHPDVHVDWDVIPREGESISLHGLDMVIRTVVWYPQGEYEEWKEDPYSPFVYIVVGKSRKW